MHRFIRHGQPVFLPEPWPDRCVAGKALGRGSTVPKRLLHRRGSQRDFAWRLADGEQLGQAATLIGRQPAPDGMPTAPEQTSHLTAGADLRALQDVESR